MRDTLRYSESIKHHLVKVNEFVSMATVFELDNVECAQNHKLNNARGYSQFIIYLLKISFSI